MFLTSRKDVVLAKTSALLQRGLVLRPALLVQVHPGLPAVLVERPEVEVNGTRHEGAALHVRVGRVGDNPTDFLDVPRDIAGLALVDVFHKLIAGLHHLPRFLMSFPTKVEVDLLNEGRGSGSHDAPVDEEAHRDHGDQEWRQHHEGPAVLDEDPGEPEARPFLQSPPQQDAAHQAANNLNASSNEVRAGCLEEELPHHAREDESRIVHPHLRVLGVRPGLVGVPDELLEGRDAAGGALEPGLHLPVLADHQLFQEGPHGQAYRQD
mmetsp:Transcript_40075/g.115573  ORF Transcript_40075/g.115573 Transcript_40075/m.115573 type:complete len:266 (-) Transcript_40075:491-1288(-)